MYVYAGMYINIACMSIYVYICIRASMYVCMYVCMYVFMYVYLHVCIYMHIYRYIYRYLCIYTHIVRYMNAMYAHFTFIHKLVIYIAIVIYRDRPKLGFGAETAKFLGFGLVSVTAATRILVSAWFRLRP